MSPIPDEPPFKAFIGNLPGDAVQGDIETILQSAEIPEDEIRRFDIKMVRDRETDMFKGFAYVEFTTREQLERVLTLRGVMFANKALKVDVASAPKKFDGQRGGGRGGRGGRGGGRGGAVGPDGWEEVHHVGRGGRGGRGGRIGGPRGDFRRESFGEEGAEPVQHADRPRLQLKPRTTDPAALEAKKKAEEEEEERRRAKIFGH